MVQARCGLPQVSKIALLNPYLCGGHLQTAEIECTAKIIRAAKNLSIDVKVFGSCEEIEFYNPDFVISMSFQTPKLTSYPTYVIQDVPVSWMTDSPRFIRNLLTYDGFLAISPTVINWLGELCATNNKKFHIANSAFFSVPQTEFHKCDFKNAIAMYIGTNWDGLRHNNLFKYLESGEYVKCYGPPKNWANYPSSLYCGGIPFDGKSVNAAYQKAGAGLCIAQSKFDDENIPTSRFFEIAAASALPICSTIKLTQAIYGDAVIYVDHTLPPKQLAQQITEAVEWIRGNSGKALEMAMEAHAIFSRQLSLEYYLNNLIAMHHKVLIENKYIPENADGESKLTLNISHPSPKITYILASSFINYTIYPLLKDIFEQSYENIEIVVLAKNGEDIKQYFKNFNNKKIKFTFIPYEGENRNEKLFNFLKQHTTEWIGILTLHDRLFSNHSALLMEALEKNVHKKNPAFLLGKSLELSNIFPLIDFIQDENSITDVSRVRLANSNYEENFILASTLINFSLYNLELFSKIDFYNLNSQEVSQSVRKLGTGIAISEVTAATNIDSILRFEFEDKLIKLQETVKQQEYILNSFYSSRAWRIILLIKKCMKLWCNMTSFSGLVKSR